MQTLMAVFIKKYKIKNLSSKMYHIIKEKVYSDGRRLKKVKWGQVPGKY